MVRTGGGARGDALSAIVEGDVALLASAIGTRLASSIARYDHGALDGTTRDRVRRAAETHRVIPLLARAAGVAAEPALRDAARRTALQALSALETLRAALGALERAGIPALAWKGPALAHAAWGDVGSREFDDLDIVVRGSDRAGAREALTAIGWRPRHPMSEAQEAAIFRGLGASEFAGPFSPPLLELHWEFSALRYAGRLPVDAVFDRAETLVVSGVVLRVPSAADTLVLLAQHGSKHGWSLLEDVAVFSAMACRSDDAVLAAHDRAVAVGGGRALRLALVLAEAVFGVRRPVAIRTACDRDEGLDALVAAVAARWRDAAPDLRPSFAWDLAWHERAADRARLLVRATFDPTIQEWTAWRLPDALVGLYPLFRPFRRAWTGLSVTVRR